MATQSRIIEIHDRRGARPWRDTEPVIVGKFLDDKGTPEHRVVPPHKFASAGDTLVFKYYDCKIDIQGDIFFEPPDYSIPNEARATLKKTLPRGIHHYKVICDGKVEAKGGSPPTVIIDP